MTLPSSSVTIMAFLLPTLILNTLVKADNMQSSFLSASFSTKLSPVTDSLFDDTKKEAFSNASQHFFQKIFSDHDANINILSVGVFDEHITKQADMSVEKLRFRQYPSDHEVTFSTVVVAQHQDKKKQPLMSSEHFYQNVIYASHEFQDHFLAFLKQCEDVYFTDVDSVHFDEYQSNRPGAGVSAQSGNNISNNNILGMSDEALNKTSFIVIAICSVLSVAFLFVSFKLQQKRKELISNRWRVEEINLATAKSLETSSDDVSFDPLVTAGESHNKKFFADAMALSGNLRTSIPSPLFEPQASKNSYTDELESLPRDTIYAPPGKLGVAIDILNGQAVVMKIRKGSPITGMLQEGDILLAIDDVDCTCMTLAEVTFLMVKNMERVRRITYVRRC
eukprot:CAMPEP_0201734974 /NCGR_PEP_ID=MMETSP0593-20130828/35874_1 /ASSEMBLY_ACC=CAM_ASM_000672 /TAXON_ID=267983 /ORGANISM="Skeletonema japonicum, Strain CCMP2506" /LENGTH=392 /DNA_ID=CAMNT_0048228449 /DNA_START=80 /DNA_END=1258 /DNA_ORIENTATION=-